MPRQGRAEAGGKPGTSAVKNPATNDFLSAAPVNRFGLARTAKRVGGVKEAAVWAQHRMGV